MSERSFFRSGIEPVKSPRLSRWVLVASVTVHGTVAVALRASAASPARPVVPEQIEIELAPPPPPEPEPEEEKAPEPEPEPEPEPVKIPPPRPERRVVEPPPKAPPPTEPATSEPSEPSEPVGTDIPVGDVPTHPAAPPGKPAPAPREVAPPAPPPPPPPVIEAREGANYLKNPRPAYPRAALREGWEGRVVLRVKVLPNGKVGGAVVQKSAGRAALDDAALEAVKSWTFVPATQGGKPVTGWVSVPFEFRLQ